jgi:aspartyl protease
VIAAADEVIEALERADHETALALVGDSTDPVAILARMTVASRERDAATVASLAAGAGRGDPGQRLAFAHLLHRSCGLAEAAPDYGAVCASGDSEQTRRACGMAAFAARTRDVEPPVVEVLHGDGAPLLADHLLPIAFASIADLPEEPVIVDTGAPDTVLSRRYCERAGIDVDWSTPGVALEGGGRELATAALVLDSLTFAGARAVRPRVSVAVFPPELAVAAIVSPLDTFPGMALEFDMRSRRLRLGDGDEWGERAVTAPLLWDGGVPFIHGTAAGVDGWFLLDSGAGGSFVTNDVAERIVGSPAGTVTSLAAGGPTDLRRLGRHEVSFGGTDPVVEDLYVKERPVDPYEFGALRPAGYAGASWLAGRRLRIGADRRQVTITPATGR